MSLSRTPMYQFHADNKAHMGEYAGWDMPLYYSSPLTEHKQVRTSGGLFDVSHMGRVKITGKHARKFLEILCSRRISDMQNGQCRYSLVCNEQGGVKDDVIVYRNEDDDYLIVVNAANRAKLLKHFDDVIRSRELTVKVDDTTESTVMVAVQGPKVMDVIGKVSKEIPTLKKYRFAIKNLMIAKVIVSRTGYTGEDGFEAILPASLFALAKSMILQDIDVSKPDAVIKPIGLVARDTLRTEAAMPLYGHELGEDINALSCGIDFAISLDKHTQERGERFIGQDVLEQAKANGGPARKLVGMFVEGKRTARQGNPILVGGKSVGIITSACPSPTLDRCIAMGFVDAALTAPGTAVEIDTGRGILNAATTPMPFYKLAK